VYAILTLQTGNILIGGKFITYLGTGCNRIVLTDSSGQLIPGVNFNFNDGGFDGGDVYVIRQLSNGNILIGGSFTEYFYNDVNEVHQNIIMVDSSGVPVPGAEVIFNNGNPYNTTFINTIELLSNGTILIGGNNDGAYNSSGITTGVFFNVDSVGTINFTINAVIYQDQTATPNTISPGKMNSAKQLSNGTILIGGAFSTYAQGCLCENSYIYNNIVLVDAEGTAIQDVAFNYPNTGFTLTDASAEVFTIQPLSDGSILIGGKFDRYNDVSANNIVWVDQSGNRLHSMFDYGFDGNVTNIAPFRNTFLISGQYQNYNIPVTIASDGSFNSIYPDNQGLLYGYTSTDTFIPPNTVLVANEMSSIFVQPPPTITSFTNLNLTGIDLSGVDLSNYDLTNTVLTNANLTNVNFTNTTITDSVAIANNIVVNSGAIVQSIQINNIDYQVYALDSTIDASCGMLALRRGINKLSSKKTEQQTNVAKFVAGLYTALAANNTPNFDSNTIVTMPATTLPGLINSYSPNNNVQLINASVYPINNTSYTPVVDISLNKDAGFKQLCQSSYTLIQNYPDTVNLYDVCGNILTISAVGPYNNDLSQVTLTQTPSGTHPFPPPSNGFTVVDNTINPPVVSGGK
jgi:hypothetical protein